MLAVVLVSTIRFCLYHLGTIAVLSPTQLLIKEVYLPDARSVQHILTWMKQRIGLFERNLMLRDSLCSARV